MKILITNDDGINAKGINILSNCILSKKFMSKKKILLLNDTETSFYKYNYKPASVNPERIKPFLILSHAGKIVFSHYGDDTKEAPALKIFVINEF